MGPDAGVGGPTNYDFVLVADFANVDDWRSYAASPEHQGVVKDFIMPVLAQRSAVQYQIPSARPGL
jgi:hypothetical protein